MHPCAGSRGLEVAPSVPAALPPSLLFTVLFSLSPPTMSSAYPSLSTSFLLFIDHMLTVSYFF